MTPSQLSALKAAALADQDAAAYIGNGQDSQLADWFNEQTTYVVWRSALTPELARAAIIAGATQLDALTVGKRDSLFWLCSGNLDVSNAGVRAAIDDLCGTQSTLKTSLQSAQKRMASHAEKALASGTGTTLSPAALGWEGFVSGNDASDIRSAV